MPVEIRELIIKTEVSSIGRNHAGTARQAEIQVLKKQLMEECKRMIQEKTKKNTHKR